METREIKPAVETNLLAQQIEDLRKENRELLARTKRLKDERLGLEQRLHEREQQLRESQRVAQLGSWSWVLGGETISWTEEVFRIYGLAPQAGPIAFSDYASLLHPDDRERVLSTIESRIEAGGPFEFEHRVVRPDGAVRTVYGRGEVQFTTDGKPYGMFGTVQDITELRQTTEALRLSESSYRTIFELASDAIFVHDVDSGTILDANRKACELHGCTLEELKALGVEGISEGTPPFDGEHARAHLQLAVRGRPHLFEWRGKHKSGKRFWVEVSLHRVSILGVDRVLASVRNIDERKLSEWALQQSREELERRVKERTAELAHRSDELVAAEQRFRAIVEASPTPLVLSRLEDGVILYANERVFSLIGIRPEDLVGKNITDFYFDPADVEVVSRIRLTHGCARDIELRIRHTDGSPRWVSLTLSCLEYDGQQAMATSLVDITRRKETEEALRASEESYRSLFDNLTELVYIQDLDGRFLNVNEAVVRAYGYSREEIIGKAPDILAAPGRVDLNDTIRRFQLALEGEPQRFDWWAIRKDGTIFPKELALNRSTYFGRPVVIAVARDISERLEAESALRRSEEHFRRLIENASDLISILDTEGNIKYQSPAVTRMMGYAPEEMVGQNAFVYMHHEDIPATLATLRQVVEHPGQRVTIGYRFRHKDGSWRFIESVGSTLSTESADDGVIVNSRDLTERLEAEQTLRLQKTILEAQGEASIDGILVVSSEGHILSCNHRFVEMWGIPQDVIEMKSDERALQAVLNRLKDPIAYQARVDYLYDHPDETAREEIELIDGRYFDRYTAPVSSHEGEHYGRIWFFRDVTAEKRRAEELELARLESEHARNQAETANQAKSQFLANMSHELRTPLNAIIGYAEMLVEEAEDSGSGNYIPDLQKIQSAGRHLLGLINDVLDLSKIEAGRMEVFYEDYEISPLIENVKNTILPLFEERRNRLVVDLSGEAGRMVSDPVKMRQILFNLLSNAAKFTEDGLVTLAVERDTPSDDWITFRVSDTGIGMTEEQLGRLFRPFTQVDASSTRRYGGTGLGLTITRRFIEMLGGSIQVESSPGVGTTFQIVLPVQGGVEPGTGRLMDLRVSDRTPVETTTTRNKSPRILVIDDDPSCREVLQRMLIKEGFNVVCAASGEEGLRIAAANPPDLITLDVMMPKLSGWDVLARLKSDPSTSRIPVLVVTVLNDKRLGYTLGAVDFITKPVTRERVLEAVTQHLPSKEETERPVLVVEDDAVTREMLRRILERDGWSVREAADGLAGLEVLNEIDPGLILLDLMMPEMDGFTFVEQMRKRPDGSETPVIVLTARDLSEEDRNRLNGRVEKVIRKGETRPSELVSDMHRLLNRRFVRSLPAG